MDDIMNDMQKIIAEKNEENDMLWERVKKLEEEISELKKKLASLRGEYDKVARLYMDISGSYFAVSKRLHDYEQADRVPRCAR